MVFPREIGLALCDTEEETQRILAHISPPEIADEAYVVTVDLTQQLLDSLNEKDFTSHKRTSRLHQFPRGVAENEVQTADSSELPLESDIPIVNKRPILESLRLGESFDDYLTTLATEYINTKYSRSGILLCVRFEENEHHLLAVIKAPFSRGYEPETDIGLSELDEIIGEELQKGAIYPRYRVSADELRFDQVNIYQRSWSKHWWRFLGVEEAKTNDQVLQNKIVTETEQSEGTQLNEIGSVAEFDQVKTEYTDDELDGKVKVSMNDVTFDVKLRDILEENIYFVRDGGYFVVLEGARPTIATKPSQNRKEIFTQLQEYHSFDDIQ